MYSLDFLLSPFDYYENLKTQLKTPMKTYLKDDKMIAPRIPNVKIIRKIFETNLRIIADNNIEIEKTAENLLAKSEPVLAGGDFDRKLLIFDEVCDTDNIHRINRIIPNMQPWFYSTGEFLKGNVEAAQEQRVKYEKNIASAGRIFKKILQTTNKDEQKAILYKQIFPAMDAAIVKQRNVLKQLEKAHGTLDMINAQRESWAEYFLFTDKNSHKYTVDPKNIVFGGFEGKK